MAWLAVDQDKTEWIYESMPIKSSLYPVCTSDDEFVRLPKGTIAKILGYNLTWENKPVELK